MTPPRGPRVGVGGVLLDAGRVLLIRRAHAPLAGRWSIPGGTVEWGETLDEALRREMLEETGLQVRVGPLLTAFDRVEREGGEVRWHYVIVDYLCFREGGELRAGSDALDAALVAPEDLARYDLPEKALEVIRDAFALAASPRPAG